MRPGSGQGVAAAASGKPRHIEIQRSFYTPLVVVFVVVFLISNINATKGVEIGPFVLDGAFFLFPIAYVVGDVLSECFGFQATRRAIFLGFGCMILAVVSFYIAIALPQASFYEGQVAFRATLGLVPQIVLASLSGYLVGQLLNSWTLVKIKARTGEKSMWARLIGSTIVGEFGDTLIFCTIAAPVIGIDSGGAFVNYVAVGFVWKTLIEVVLLPVTYSAIGWVKRREDY